MKYEMMNSQDGNIQHPLKASSELDALHEALGMAGWTLVVIQDYAEREYVDIRVGSKLITEFMHHPNFDSYDSAHQDEILDECDYDSSWNSLIYVIVKISSSPNNIHQQIWQQIMDHHSMMTAVCKGDILVPFNCVVEFIEWHNEQKEREK